MRMILKSKMLFSTTYWHIGDGIINTEAISVGQAEVFYGDLMFSPETNIDYFARLLYFDNNV